MATDHIIALMIAERDKINRAIEALSSPATPVRRRGRPPKNLAAAMEPVAVLAKKAHKKWNFSPEQREAASLRMKQRWAKRRRAAKAAS